MLHVVVSANLLHGFGQFNLRKPRWREREVGCKRGKAFKLPPCSADQHNRIAHQAQRSQILTSSPLSAVSLYSSHSLLRRCHTARELSRVLQNTTSKSVEKVRGYNMGRDRLPEVSRGRAHPPPCSPADTCQHLWSPAARGVLRGASRQARRRPCRACCRPPWLQGSRLDPGLAQNLLKPPAQGEQEARGGRVLGGLDHGEQETSAPRRELD